MKKIQSTHPQPMVRANLAKIELISVLLLLLVIYVNATTSLLRWGGFTSYKPLLVSRGDILMVESKGADHTLFVQQETNGIKLYGVGLNDKFQLGQSTSARTVTKPIEITGVADIALLATGKEHSVLVTAYSEIFTFGSNSHGQLGVEQSTTSQNNPTRLTSISMITGESIISACAGEASTYILTSTNKLLATTQSSPIFTPTLATIPTGVSLESIESCAFDTLIVRSSENTFYGVGDNSNNKLGNPTVNSAQSSQFIMVNLDNLGTDEVPTKIQCGTTFCAMLTNKLKVYTWGDSKYLGRYTFELEFVNPAQPTSIAIPENKLVVDIAVGARHVLFTTEDGSVYAFGDNDAYQIGRSSTSTPFRVPKLISRSLLQKVYGNRVYAGRTQSFALEADATCSSLVDNSPNVCYKRGSCVAAETCRCHSQCFVGSDCQNYNGVCLPAVINSAVMTSLTISPAERFVLQSEAAFSEIYKTAFGNSSFGIDWAMTSSNVDSTLLSNYLQQSSNKWNGNLFYLSKQFFSKFQQESFYIVSTLEPQQLLLEFAEKPSRTDYLTLHLVPYPQSISISGGNTMIASNNSLTLKVQSNFLSMTGVTCNWTCEATTLQNGNVPCPMNSAESSCEYIILPSQQLSTDVHYSFRVQVNSTFGQMLSAATTVQVRALEEVPSISIISTPLHLQSIPAHQSLSLYVNILNQHKRAVVYQWTQMEGSNITESMLEKGGLDKPSLQFKAHSLQSNQQYTFSVVATFVESGISATASVTFTVKKTPLVIDSFTCNEVSGVTLQTVVTCQVDARIVDVAYVGRSIRYTFGYMDTSANNQSATEVTYLHQYPIYSKTFTSTLPLGSPSRYYNLQLVVMAMIDDTIVTSDIVPIQITPHLSLFTNSSSVMSYVKQVVSDLQLQQNTFLTDITVLQLLESIQYHSSLFSAKEMDEMMQQLLLLMSDSLLRSSFIPMDSQQIQFLGTVFGKITALAPSSNSTTTLLTQQMITFLQLALTLKNEVQVNSVAMDTLGTTLLQSKASVSTLKSNATEQLEATILQLESLYYQLVSQQVIVGSSLVVQTPKSSKLILVVKGSDLQEASFDVTIKDSDLSASIQLGNDVSSNAQEEESIMITIGLETSISNLPSTLKGYYLLTMDLFQVNSFGNVFLQSSSPILLAFPYSSSTAEIAETLQSNLNELQCSVWNNMTQQWSSNECSAPSLNALTSQVTCNCSRISQRYALVGPSPLSMNGDVKDSLYWLQILHPLIVNPILIVAMIIIFIIGSIAFSMYQYKVQPERQYKASPVTSLSWGQWAEEHTSTHHLYYSLFVLPQYTHQNVTRMDKWLLINVIAFVVFAINTVFYGIEFGLPFWARLPLVGIPVSLIVAIPLATILQVLMQFTTNEHVIDMQGKDMSQMKVHHYPLPGWCRIIWYSLAVILMVISIILVLVASIGVFSGITSPVNLVYSILCSILALLVDIFVLRVLWVVLSGCVAAIIRKVILDKEQPVKEQEKQEPQPVQQLVQGVDPQPTTPVVEQKTENLVVAVPALNLQPITSQQEITNVSHPNVQAQDSDSDEDEKLSQLSEDHHYDAAHKSLSMTEIKNILAESENIVDISKEKQLEELEKRRREEEERRQQELIADAEKKIAEAERREREELEAKRLEEERKAKEEEEARKAKEEEERRQQELVAEAERKIAEAERKAKEEEERREQELIAEAERKIAEAERLEREEEEAKAKQLQEKLLRLKQMEEDLDKPDEVEQGQQAKTVSFSEPQVIVPEVPPSPPSPPSEAAEIPEAPPKPVTPRGENKKEPSVSMEEHLQLMKTGRKQLKHIDTLQRNQFREHAKRESRPNLSEFLKNAQEGFNLKPASQSRPKTQQRETSSSSTTATSLEEHLDIIRKGKRLRPVLKGGQEKKVFQAEGEEPFRLRKVTGEIVEPPKPVVVEKPVEVIVIPDAPPPPPAGYKSKKK